MLLLPLFCAYPSQANGISRLKLLGPVTPLGGMVMIAGSVGLVILILEFVNKYMARYISLIF